MKIEYVQVDKDVLNFLKVIFFGDISDSFKAASYRAYLDFNRTLRFGTIEEDTRKNLKEKATKILRERISGINSDSITSQEKFDAWHKETCRVIRQIYKETGMDFSWGQAQKWLNMTIKYLYVLGACDFADVFRYCHIPVDNYVFKSAKKELGISLPRIAWSRWEDYDGQYLDYQNQLRTRIKDLYPQCEPLRWEFKYWMEEARNLTQE